MTKITKALIGSAGLFLSLFLITGCTKSFCSINDKANMIATYESKNKTEIDKKADTAGVMLPGEEYWAFLEAKVVDTYTKVVDDGEKVYKDALASGTQGDYKNDFVPASYIESHIKYLHATNEEEKKSLVNTDAVKAVIKFAGYNVEGKEELWFNFLKWTEEANKKDSLKNLTPTNAYLVFYQNQISTGIGTTVTCLTPDSGYFGTEGNIYVEGKTWGQAFTEYGPIEGLLVYPIGYLLHVFTATFGIQGGGQILAIFLVTLIVRAIIVAMSFQTTLSQSRMSLLQPQIAMLQAKYPNSQTNNYEKQKLAQEQMLLYKKNHIHPFRQILVLIVQFPVFIAVWGAMQGSSILTQGSVFGLSLSTITYKAILGWNSETPFAIILFLMMSIAQFFSTKIPLWIQAYRKSHAVGAKTVKVQEDTSQATMMKWMPLIMMVMIIFMGLTLPAAMGIYWFFGAIISIIQTVLTEIYQSTRKNKKPKITKSKKVNSKKMKLRG